MEKETQTPVELFIESDPGFAPYREIIKKREAHVASALASSRNSRWHQRNGLHFSKGGWSFREWLPNALSVWLVGDFNGWQCETGWQLSRVKDGYFEGRFPGDAITPGQLYKLYITWSGGQGYRLPAEATYVRRNTQDISRGDVLFNGVVPQERGGYQWRHANPGPIAHPLIYESHIGMAQDKYGIGTFEEFRTQVLPRVVKAGYNVVQLMGVMEHPYYASFGYHVSNFYAVTDLFGTPDDFKRLVDEAHGMGLGVIMDLVHSHSAPNSGDGLSFLDGSDGLYFHSGERGVHSAWGSRCFDYGKKEVRSFLASNCRFWLEEYHLDGFRFDGVTSMLYLDHGLGRGGWSYQDYFSMNVDWDAYAYLCLANQVIHEVNPDAITIAEDVSGFPGLTVPREQGGCGFNYRLAMGVTDYWFKLTDISDDDWSMGTLWYELTGKRKEEHCLSYVESHDQALVGGKTFLFTLAGPCVYDSMSKYTENAQISRSIALHNMARLITLATADSGYLNFMGNEFGHPEWIDFPCDRNGWSTHYARRQWHLLDDTNLRYGYLAEFDRKMLELAKKEVDFFDVPPMLLRQEEREKVLAFRRGKLLFVFNFHPNQALVDYPVLAFPGSYDLVLDTDRYEFGGFGRIQEGQRFFSRYVVEDNCRKDLLAFYLPPRTAVVVRMCDSPNALTKKTDKR